MIREYFAVVVAAVVACNAGVSRVVICIYIVNCMAIMVVAHKRVHICVIMSVVNRGAVPEVAREMIPVPRRMPRTVTGSAKVIIYRWSGNEYRLYDIFRSENIRISDYLYVGGSNGRNLGHDCRNVLEKVSVQYCLNQEDVRVSIYGLKNAEVVDISVSVKIQVGQHI